MNMVNFSDVRANLIDCGNNSNKEVSIKRFVESFENLEINNSLEKSFYAVSLAYKAKLCLNPIKKINYLNLFHKFSDEAVEEAKNSFEVVFLRFLIQKNLPQELGFSNSIKDDNQFLTENLHAIDSLGFDKAYKKFMIGFLNQLNQKS
jgi:hypothetical protein